jgi:carbamoyl-phosphate synthase large subunit
MNVLLSSASRHVNLVRAFQQALKREGGGKVIAVDASPRAAALYFADECYLVPQSDSPEFLDVMLRLCRKREVKLLVPSRDEELPFFAEHKAKFAAAGTTVMVAGGNAIKICQDKQLFIQFCRDNGFAVPETYGEKEFKTSTAFPLFVKPRYGKGGRQTTRIDSPAELELALKNARDAIVQKFIGSPEYTIDLFADFSGRVISVVPRERLLVFGGESFVSRTSKNPHLMQESVRLAEKLQLIGHNTIQCFLSDDKVDFIEVNPRFGGGANLGFAAGAPTPLYLVQLLKGKKLAPQIGKFKDNFYMLRYTEDKFLEKKSLTPRMFA